MKNLLLMGVALLCVLGSDAAGSNDFGVPDTVKLVGGPLKVGESIPLQFTIVNDYDVETYSLGFISSIIDSGFAIWDSVVYVNRMADPSVIQFRIAKFGNGDLEHGVPPDTLLMGGLKAAGNALPPGNEVVAQLFFTGLTPGLMAIDSGYFPPAGQFILSGPGSGGGYGPMFATNPIGIVSGTLPPSLSVSSQLIRTVAGASIAVDVAADSPEGWPVSLAVENMTGYDDKSMQPTSAPSMGVASPTVFGWTPTLEDVGVWLAEISACDSGGNCASAFLQIQVVSSSDYLIDFHVSETNATDGMTSMLQGNFDGDPYPELFVTSLSGYEAMPAQMFDFVPPNQFLLSYDYGVHGLPAVAVQAGYLNMDEHLDACFMNSDGSVYRLRSLLGDGFGGFSLADEYPSGRVTRQSVLGEYSGDGRLDYVSHRDDSLYIYYGNALGDFSLGHQFVTDDTVLTLNTADFNSDGRDDLALGTETGLTIYLQSEVGQFTVGESYAQTYGAIDLEVTNSGSDFNEDDFFDLCISTPSVAGSESELVVYLGNGDGTLTRTLTRTLLGQVFGNAVGDFNGDGHLDIAFLNGAHRYLSLMFGEGDGTFVNEVRYPIPTSFGKHLEAADFDLDGDLDLVIGTFNYLGGNPLILFLNGLNPGGFAQTVSAVTALKNCDLELTSTSGRVVNRVRNTMPASNLYRIDVDSDGILDYRFEFGAVEQGEMRLQAGPRPGFPEGETFSLEFTIDGELHRLVHDLPMTAGGYEFPVYLDGNTDVWPPSGVFSGANPPSFTWSGSSTFDLQLASDIDFASLIVDIQVEGNTYSHPTALEVSDTTAYYWRIKPAGQSEFDCLYVLNLIPAPSSDCGDANDDGMVSITDAVYLINYVFAGGPPPEPLLRADVDCSSTINISDVVYLIMYIFASGPQPCADCP